MAVLARMVSQTIGAALRRDQDAHRFFTTVSAFRLAEVGQDTERMRGRLKERFEYERTCEIWAVLGDDPARRVDVVIEAKYLEGASNFGHLEMTQQYGSEMPIISAELRIPDQAAYERMILALMNGAAGRHHTRFVLRGANAHSRRSGHAAQPFISIDELVNPAAENSFVTMDLAGYKVLLEAGPQGIFN
jgi:hypothetical protein